MRDHQAWLAQTVEEVIEPELVICDPHHHLWDHPGNRYLLDEFTADLDCGHRVVKTVFVECLQFYSKDGAGALSPVGETVYVDAVAGRVKTRSGPCDVAAGIVGFADLCLGSRVEEVLDAHQSASERFRGVRHASAWDASDRIHNAHTRPPPGLLNDRQFRRGIACLESTGLSFDAWLYHAQIPELTDLALAFPGLTIILNHMGGPLGIGPYADFPEEVFRQWAENLKQLAACENVAIKLGGRTMSMSGFGWHKREKPVGSAELAEAMAPYYQVCIDNFGVERCMFESNFPVDRLSCSYTVLWNAFKRLCRNATVAERSALLHDTATRIYQLNG